MKNIHLVLKVVSNGQGKKPVSRLKSRKNYNFSALNRQGKRLTFRQKVRGNYSVEQLRTLVSLVFIGNCTYGQYRFKLEFFSNFFSFAIWNTMMGTSLLSMPWALQQVFNSYFLFFVKNVFILLNVVHESCCETLFRNSPLHLIPPLLAPKINWPKRSNYSQV